MRLTMLSSVLWYRSPLQRLVRFRLRHPNHPTLFVSAVYDRGGSGIHLTDVPEDACSYVTIEKACEVARDLKDFFGDTPDVEPTDG